MTASKDVAFVTLGQQFAQRAWACVNERVKPGGQEAPGALCKKYRSRARQQPTLVLQSGLAQTVAFCQSRSKSSAEDKDQYGAWLQDIATVLVVPNGVAGLTEKSRTSELQDYMALTHRVLLAAQWLKSYAEALIDPPEREDD